MHAVAGLSPFTSIQKKRDVCLVQSCGKPSQGKPYCLKHSTIGARRALPDGMRQLIRSACCDANCTKGEPHDNGEQYCDKCKEPCCWKAP